MKSTKQKRHGVGAKSDADARQTWHPKKKARQERAATRQEEEAKRPTSDPRRRIVRLTAKRMAA